MDNLSAMQDQELVALFKEGSKKAFKELYIRYEQKLISFCKRSLKDESSAEDITHDVFMQVFETHEALNPEKFFYGYLKTIAKNRILYELRKADMHLRYVNKTIMYEKDVTNQTEDQIIDNDYEKLLTDMIDALTPQQKEVIRLSRVQGLTYNEIADMLNISLRTVKKHASLALEKIKRQLTEHADLYFKTVITFLIFFS